METDNCCFRFTSLIVKRHFQRDPKGVKMIKIVKKSSGEYILGCGAIETKIAPMELKEVSRNKIKLLGKCKCGLIQNIIFNGEMEVKLAS